MLHFCGPGLTTPEKFTSVTKKHTTATTTTDSSTSSSSLTVGSVFLPRTRSDKLTRCGHGWKLRSSHWVNACRWCAPRVQNMIVLAVVSMVSLSPVVGELCSGCGRGCRYGSDRGCSERWSKTRRDLVPELSIATRISQSVQGVIRVKRSLNGFWNYKSQQNSRDPSLTEASLF